MFAAERLLVLLTQLFIFACSSCKLILEEGALQHPHGAEKEMSEFKKLQVLSDLMRESFSAFQPCLIKSSRGSQSTAPDRDELSPSLSTLLLSPDRVQ